MREPRGRSSNSNAIMPGHRGGSRAGKYIESKCQNRKAGSEMACLFSCTFQKVIAISSGWPTVKNSRCCRGSFSHPFLPCAVDFLIQATRTTIHSVTAKKFAEL